MAKRNLKLTPEVRLPAVIQPRRPLPTPETDGRRAAGELFAVEPVYVVAAKLVTLHHLPHGGVGAILSGLAFIIHTRMDSETIDPEKKTTT